LTPSNEKPNETNVYTCDLVEHFLFALCKSFAEQLIRKTCADIYFDSSRADTTDSNKKSKLLSNSDTVNKLNQQLEGTSKKKNDLLRKASSSSCLLSLALNGSNTNPTNMANEYFTRDSILYQKFPQTLSVPDIFATINKHEIYDFLTNKYMAFPNDMDNNDNNNNNNKTNNKPIQLYNNKVAEQDNEAETSNRTNSNKTNVTSSLSSKTATKVNLNQKFLTDFSFVN
jgi:hypothetical protein